MSSLGLSLFKCQYGTTQSPKTNLRKLATKTIGFYVLTTDYDKSPFLTNKPLSSFSNASSKVARIL